MNAEVVPLPVDRGSTNAATDMLAGATSVGVRRSLDGASSLGRTVNRTGRAVNGTVESIASSAGNGVRAATRRLTEETTGATDDWGRDPLLVRNMMWLAQLRWDVATGGDQHLPKRNGALLVVNSPFLAFSTIFTAFAVSEAIDRPVRFLVPPGRDRRGLFNRRIGGLLDHPDELAGALRAGEVVVMSAATATGSRSVGEIDHTLIGAALATGSKVFPVAASSSPFGRRARVEIGTAIKPPRRRKGPLSELELADRLRTDIGDLLSAMGDISTGTPLDWLPLSGIGAH